MKTLALIGSALLAAACGAKSKGESSQTPDAKGSESEAASAALRGTWRMGCSETEDTGLPTGTKSQSSIYNFATPTGPAATAAVSLEDDFFSDATCQQPLLKSVLTATYHVGRVLSELPGGHELDLVSVDVTATPQDRSKTLADPCAPDKTLTAVATCSGGDIFQIFKIEGSTLFLGEETANHDASSATMRPAGWNSPGLAKSP